MAFLIEGEPQTTQTAQQDGPTAVPIIPEPSTQPARAGTPQPPAGAFTFEPEPPPPHILNVGRTLIDAAGAVKTRFLEGTKQAADAIYSPDPEDERGVGSRTLSGIGGILKAALPFGAAADLIGTRFMHDAVTATQELQDDALDKRIEFAKLHAPGEVPFYEALRSVPYEERVKRVSTATGESFEQVSGLIPGYTGAISLANKLLGRGAKAAAGAAHVVETAGKTAREVEQAAEAARTASRAVDDLAQLPPEMAQNLKFAHDINNAAPPIAGTPGAVEDGMTRLFRHQPVGAEEGGFVGLTENGVSIYRDAGPLHYVDVPTKDLVKYQASASDAAQLAHNPMAEFVMPKGTKFKEYYGPIEETALPGASAEKATAKEAEKLSADVTLNGEKVGSVTIGETPTVSSAKPEYKVPTPWAKLPRERLSDEARQNFREVLRSGNIDAAFEKIGVFNAGKWDSAESVKATISDLANIAGEEMKATNRTAVKTHQEVKELADLLGETPAHVTTALSRMAKDASHMDDIVVAGKAVVQSMTREILDLARAIDTGVHGQRSAIALEAELARRTDILTEVMENLSKVQTGAARATSAGRIRTADTISKDSLEKMLEAAGGRDYLRKLAERIALVDNPSGVAAAVRGTPKGFLGKFLAVHNTWWIQGLLSNPKTWEVNFISDAINGGLMPMVRSIGGVMDAAVTSKLYKRSSAEGIKQAKEGIYQYIALRSVVNDSIKAAWQAFKQGHGVLDPGYAKIELPLAGQAGIPAGWLATGVNTLGEVAGFGSRRVLSATDELFEQLAYRSHVFAQAAVEGRDLGLKGKELKAFIDDTLKASIHRSTGLALDEQALKSAQEAVWTNSLKTDTWFGERSFGEIVQNAARDNPLLRATVLPFTRVPINLTRSAIDYGPLALSQRRFWAALEAGGEEAAKAQGKLAVGSLMWAAAGFLAMEGVVTGGGPSDPEARAKLMQTGWRPYSVRIGTGDDGKPYYVSIQRLDPFSWIFGFAADFHAVSDDLEKKGLSEKIALGASVTLAQKFADLTYIKGLVQVFDLLSHQAQESGNKAKYYIQNRLASYVPSGFQVFKTDNDVKILRDWFDGMTARLPFGMNSGVEAKRDIFGEKLVGASNWNAFSGSSRQNDPVREELAYLAINSREARFPVPGDKITIPGVVDGLDLTQFKNSKGQTAADRRRELMGAELGGKTLYEAIGEVIQSDEYKKAKSGMAKGDPKFTSYLAVDMIKRVIHRYEQAADRDVRREFKLDAVIREQKRNRVLNKYNLPR